MSSAEVSDGDLVRLARDGDPVAFRLLAERHLPMARARARQLCANPSDVDDVVQESLLRAYTGLDRLRDPDRFAGWLAGIVLNTCRGLRRQVPVVLLGDWPEPIHPASDGGVPSAEDLDRAGAVQPRWRCCPRASGGPWPCTTTPGCRPVRRPPYPARPGPACTRPGCDCGPTSPSTVPTSFPRRGGPP